MRKIVKKYRGLPVLVKASFWFLICTFLQKGISMLTTPIFTRLLSTSEYGQYSIFYSWLGIMGIFVSFNLASGVYQQGLVKFSGDENRFSSSLQGLTTVFVSCWIFVYLLTHNFWNSITGLSTIQMLCMFLLIWTSTIFNFWCVEQRNFYRYKMLVVITILVSVAKPVVGIVFVLNSNDKVTARILGIVLVELFGYFWLYIIQLKKGKKFYDKAYWRYALLFNLPLIPHYLSQTVLNSADRIMIGSMVGDSEAGIYGLAYSLSSIMIIFNTSLMQTIGPWIYKKIKDGKVKDIEPIAYISLIIISFVNLLLILFAPEAVAFFAPKSYYDAIWIIPPVAMSVYFMYIYDLFARFAFYFEKTKMIMLASVVGAITNIILNYIFIRIFGYIAAGYTTLVCYMIFSVAHYILMNKICKNNCEVARPYSTCKLMLITIPFLGVGFLLLLTYKMPFVRYGIMLLTMVMVFLYRNRIILVLKKVMKVGKN